jgi:hypothetical protein
MKVMYPLMPTVEERRERETMHLAFRVWCLHCMQGRGKARRRARQEEGGVYELHIDYCSHTSTGGEGTVMLVAREGSTRMTMATVVPRKGTLGEFAAKKGWCCP